MRLAIRNYIVLHPDPHILKNVRIPTFSASNHFHVKLAELSETANKATLAGHTEEVIQTEEKVDHLAAKLWDLSDEELAEIKRSLGDI